LNVVVSPRKKCLSHLAGRTKVFHRVGKEKGENRTPGKWKRNDQNGLSANWEKRKFRRTSITRLKNDRKRSPEKVIFLTHHNKNN